MGQFGVPNLKKDNVILDILKIKNKFLKILELKLKIVKREEGEKNSENNQLNHVDSHR